MKFLVEVDVNPEKLVCSAAGDPRAADSGPPETAGDVIALLYQEFHWLAESGIAPLDIIQMPSVLKTWMAEDIHLYAAQIGHWCSNEEAENLLKDNSGSILEAVSETVSEIFHDLVIRNFWEHQYENFPTVCPFCFKEGPTHDEYCPYIELMVEDL